MKKRIKIILPLIIIFCIIGGIYIANKFNNQTPSSNDSQQNAELDSTIHTKAKPIDEYSEEFIENYFEGTEEIIKEDNLDNVLIVGSNAEILDGYGASKIVPAPNNQYFLQYDSPEEKDNALKSFKENNEIDYVEENIIYKIQSYNSWGITKMGLDSAMQSATNLIGSNLPEITVAIIDTGCNMTTFNNNYPGKITESYNALTDSNDISDMSDTHGHGTHIAGTIAEGTPSNVKIYPVKVSESGDISNIYIIRSIYELIFNDKANVINMSFGSYDYDSAMYTAIEFANDCNIICVAAAGNDNKADPSYPAAFDNTISIAACDSSLKRANFSNYNSTVTFSAPGENIKSINGTMSGTSMATPHAAAAIAILKSYNIDYTLEDVISILRKYATDLGDQGRDVYYGYGFINFKNIEYCTCGCTDCDKIYCFYCDCEDCNFKVYNDNVTKIELVSPALADDNLLEYNYGSLTNLSNLQLRIYYDDENYTVRYLLELEDCEITGYNPYSYTEQTITINYGGKQTSFTLEQTSRDCGWEYSAIESENIKLTKYIPTTYHKGKSLEKIYIPETINGLNVTSLGSELFVNANLKYVFLPNTLTIIGEYAFSGCINLESIIIPENVTEIKTAAFQNCKKIENINIPQKVSNIGNYVFYDCSNIEAFTVDSNNSYYDSRNNCNAIIKTSTNTLVYGTHNTIIPLDVETIGRYAFSFNTNLTNITIPNSVTKILDYAFYNCTNLVEVVGLKNVTSIGDSSFGNISNLELALFQDTYAQTYADNKNINYIYLSLAIPIEKSYTAFDTVNTQNLTITLKKNNLSVENINSGFNITYANNDSFRYGDTEFSITFGSQILGAFEEVLPVTINKATPTYSIPDNLIAIEGQTLSEIVLTDNFEWMDSSQTITGTGDITCKAKYTPIDSDNYKIIENIDIHILVSPAKVAITPNISVTSKTYDGTLTLDNSSIIISNLETTDYTIESATLQSANVGNTTVTIKIKLTNEKFINYTLDNDEQENEYTVNVTIVPLKDTNSYFSDYDGIYDGSEHSIVLNIALTNATIKYSIDNKTFDLTELPKYKDIGIYTIYYKISKDNFEDITGSNTVRIYGITSFASTLDLRNNTLVIKDYDNTFTSICDRITTFATSRTYTHYNSSNTLVTDSTTKTGDIIKININNQKDFTYNISILGDVNGDGKISALDYVRIKNHIMNTSTISSEIYLTAADVNDDGKISALDYVRIKNYIMK